MKALDLNLALDRSRAISVLEIRVMTASCALPFHTTTHWTFRPSSRIPQNTR
jgi:hypothetical protein